MAPARDPPHLGAACCRTPGVDIDDIADAAGHVNSSVTRNVYRHQMADQVTKAAAAMDQIFGQVSGS
jgi:integrase